MSSAPASLTRIHSLDDPRVAAYRNLQDHELDRRGRLSIAEAGYLAARLPVAGSRNLKDHGLDRRGRLFIAGGEYVAARLPASGLPVESVFLSEKRVEEMGPQVPPGVPVYVASPDVMNGVLGMKFHSGV